MIHGICRALKTVIHRVINIGEFLLAGSGLVTKGGSRRRGVCDRELGRFPMLGAKRCREIAEMRVADVWTIRAGFHAGNVSFAWRGEHWRRWNF